MLSLAWPKLCGQEARGFVPKNIWCWTVPHCLNAWGSGCARKKEAGESGCWMGRVWVSHLSQFPHSACQGMFLASYYPSSISLHLIFCFRSFLLKASKKKNGKKIICAHLFLYSGKEYSNWALVHGKACTTSPSPPNTLLIH